VDSYKLQLDELASYSRKNKKPTSSFEDGRRALIIANAAKTSLKLKKRVTIKF
jgi:myo-inositol 2-dehydrogenase/D-chiro-inositol 1-dehydrogenase